MADVYGNRVRQYTSTSGTGSLTLGAAVAQYQTFAAGIGGGNVCRYTLVDVDGVNWEVGIGTLSGPGTTLVRTTVLNSTNANAAINLSVGTHQVFNTPDKTQFPVALAGADKQVQYNNAGAFGAEAGFEYNQATNTLTVDFENLFPTAVPDVASILEANGTAASTLAFGGWAGYFALETPAGGVNNQDSVVGVVGIARNNLTTPRVLTNAVGLEGVARNVGTGTITNVIAVRADIDAAGGTITNGYGVKVISATISGGGVITTNYGLQVENQTVGVTNYSCWLGSGLYHFDALTASQFVSTNASKNLTSLSPSAAVTLLAIPMGITFIIDGGGSAITTGIKGDLEIPFACTITAATLLADQSGSVVIDIWKDTYANYPPTVADTITAAAKPTIVAAVKSQDTTLTGWTTAIAAGDTLRFNVDSIATIQRVTLSLKITKT